MIDDTLTLIGPISPKTDYFEAAKLLQYLSKNFQIKKLIEINILAIVFLQFRYHAVIIR